MVAVTRKGAAAAEEIKAQSVRRAAQVAAAAAAREAHIRTLKAKRMAELTKDLSADNAARAQAIADEVEAISTGKVRERMKEAGGRQQAGGRLRHAMAKGDIGELEAAIAEAEAAPKMPAAAAARVPYDGAEASVRESCVASADGEVEVEECFVQYG